MPTLFFQVQTNSGDAKTDTEYLQKLQEIFRGITEGIQSFGYTDDESISFSKVVNETTTP